MERAADSGVEGARVVWTWAEDYDGKALPRQARDVA